MSNAQDFRDDGGTPAFRARQRAARFSPFWLAIRFLWLFPLIAIGAALVFFGLWLIVTALFGNAAFWTSSWELSALFSVAVAWPIMVGKQGLGHGPIGLPRGRPINTGWDALRVVLGSIGLSLYGAYVVLFWVLAVGLIWAERAVIFKPPAG
jgi:hypothetical protein